MEHGDGVFAGPNAPNECRSDLNRRAHRTELSIRRAIQHHVDIMHQRPRDSQPRVRQVLLQRGLLPIHGRGHFSECLRTASQSDSASANLKSALQSSS
jgi:hypothetical protein